MRSRKASGVGELQADDKIVRVAESRAMRLAQSFEQLRESGPIRGGRQQLMRIGPARRAGRPPPRRPTSSLAPLRPMFSQRRRVNSDGDAVPVRVPTFHRMNAPAIAHAERAHLERCGQGRMFARRSGSARPRAVPGRACASRVAQRGRSLELGDFHVRVRHPRLLPGWPCRFTPWPGAAD